MNDHDETHFDTEEDQGAEEELDSEQELAAEAVIALCRVFKMQMVGHTLDVAFMALLETLVWAGMGKACFRVRAANPLEGRSRISDSYRKG